MTQDVPPILVVGARAGLGRAVAERLVAEGRRIIATVRSADQAPALAAALGDLAEVAVLDLGDANTVQDSLSARFRSASLAGVIVCAAECQYGPLEIAPLDAARRMMEVNAISCVAIYSACLPALRRSQSPLVLVSSNSGLVSLPFMGHYQASKFALEAYADVMRMEAAKWGVPVILVEPGGMDTPMSRAIKNGIQDDTNALGPEKDALYGDLYRGFGAILAASGSGTDVAVVAARILEIMGTPDPEPRYPIGDDTMALIEQRRALSDREMDRFARGLFGIAPPTEK